RSLSLELKSLATDGRVTCRWVLLLILPRLTLPRRPSSSPRRRLSNSVGVMDIWQSIGTHHCLRVSWFKPLATDLWYKQSNFSSRPNSPETIKSKWSGNRTRLSIFKGEYLLLKELSSVDLLAEVDSRERVVEEASRTGRNDAAAIENHLLDERNKRKAKKERQRNRDLRVKNCTCELDLPKRFLFRRCCSQSINPNQNPKFPPNPNQKKTQLRCRSGQMKQNLSSSMKLFR
uniref:Uncharacterized protein n=1 Tax=Cucumis melo TaxID=3656 RepID=A0A9I9EI28_CUCME